MKKSVLILNYGLHISGVSRTLVNFANSLARHGYDVAIKLAANDFTLADELDQRVKCSLFLNEWRVLGLRVRGFLRFYQLFMKLLEKIPAVWQYRLVVRQKFDVEIAFNRGAAARIISASTNKTAKKLVWVHSDYMSNSNPLAGFENLEDASCAYAKFDRVVCVSEQAEKSFRQKFGDTANITTRYNIMDVGRIKEAASEKIPKSRFVAVAVGRLCEAKNYQLLLDAVDILNQRSVNFDLWIVGDGELRQDLLQYKGEKRLNNVIFWGAKENPYPYFASADLYVSSSIYEGLSTTTIEALILGKPVVVTDCTGMRDILGDSQWGVVVPIEVSALANAIERMIINTDHREYFEKQALLRGRDFDPEESFRKIEELM